MYKYKKEIENLINSVKIDNNEYFKDQKDIKINENSVLILQKKIDKINRQKKNLKGK